jgi:peptidoglycan/LPS O-acetylase OafA/YrhL
MAFYSLAVIALLYWQAYRRVSRRQADSGRGQRIWRTLSNASFGMYLVHPLFLTPLLSLAAALSTWPVVLVVILTWALTSATSLAFCVLLLHIPLLSRLVGREQPMPPVLATLRSNLARRAQALAGNWLPSRAEARREDR